MTRTSPRHAFAPPFPVVVAAVAGAVAAAGVAGSGGPFVAVAASLAVATSAAIADVRTRLVPDGLVVATVVPVVVAASVEGVVAHLVAGGLLAAAPLLALHVVAPTGLGFGDVKLGAALGAVAGVVDPRAALLAVALAAALGVAAGLVTGARSVPFAPALVAGTTVAVALAAVAPLTGVAP